MKVLGLISGSSLDGLDIAICQFIGLPTSMIEWKVLFTTTVEFPDDLAANLRKATSLTSRDLLKLDVEFSKFCSQAVSEILKDQDEEVDYLASHGHTVFHYPEEGYTLQIGKGSIMAEMTGISCITDFRANDIAQGGQGAPVAPIVEQYLYPGYDVYFNLGGIANFSIHKDSVIKSIDSCPCNQVLNFLINKKGETFDDKGLVARSGKVNEQLLKEWAKLEYFSQAYPKSMDNSWVQETFIPIMENFTLSIEDGLATMVEFCATQLCKDINELQRQSKDETSSGFVTGGGAYNDFLIERMNVHFSIMGLSLNLPDAETIEFKEAILMALMGYLRIQKIANTIPTVTGADKGTIGGAVYLSSL